MSLHSVGLSLVNTVPEELLYTYVYQIEANYKVTKNHEQGCIRIKDIQVYTFPLLLRIRLLLNNINPCSLLLALWSILVSIIRPMMTNPRFKRISNWFLKIITIMCLVPVVWFPMKIKRCLSFIVVSIGIHSFCHWLWMDRNTMDKNRTNIEGGVVFMDKLIIKIDENYMYKVYDTLKEFSVYIFYSFFHY